LLCSEKISVIILSAGLSSRFAPLHKALDPPEGAGLLRLCHNLFKIVGLDQVLAVTGYNESQVSELASKINLETVFNPDYKEGMFSSAITGLRAAPRNSEALIIMPVDAALLHPQNLLSLLAAWFDIPVEKRKAKILIPSYKGKNGHPPIIGRSHIPHIMTFRGKGGLRGAFSALLGQEQQELFLKGFTLKTGKDCPIVFQEQINNTILCDIDKLDDFNNFNRNIEGKIKRIPSVKEALTLLKLSNLSSAKLKHSLVVANGAESLARAWKNCGGKANPNLTLISGLLHDISRLEDNHALQGRSRLEALSFSEVALIVGAHTDPPSEILEMARIFNGTASDVVYRGKSEEFMVAALAVYLSDKYFIDDTFGALEKRFFKAEKDLFDNPIALESVKRRKALAFKVADFFTKKILTDPFEIIQRDLGEFKNREISLFMEEIRDNLKKTL